MSLSQISKITLRLHMDKYYIWPCWAVPIAITAFTLDHSGYLCTTTPQPTCGSCLPWASLFWFPCSLHCPYLSAYITTAFTPALLYLDPYHPRSTCPLSIITVDLTTAFTPVKINWSYDQVFSSHHHLFDDCIHARSVIPLSISPSTNSTTLAHPSWLDDCVYARQGQLIS
jgi:hypothetical protein